MCCLAKEIFIDFMVYRQPFPVLPNLEKWPWSSPSAFFPLILHSPNYSKTLHSDLPIIFKILGTKMSPTTPPSFYCTVWAFAAAGQDWTATEPGRQMAKCCLDGAAKEEKPADGQNIHLLVTPDKLHHAPCEILLHPLVGPALLAITIAMGWLKTLWAIFGQVNTKKSCKNRVANPKLFVFFFFIHHSQAASPGAALSGSGKRKEKPLLCGRRFARGSLIHTSRCCRNRHRKGAQMSSPSWLSCRRGTGNTAKRSREGELALNSAQIQGTSWELRSWNPTTQQNPQRRKWKAPSADRGVTFSPQAVTDQPLSPQVTIPNCADATGRGHNVESTAGCAQAFWEKAAISEKEKREFSLIQLPWLQVLTGKEAALSLSLWQTACSRYLNLN